MVLTCIAAFIDFMFIEQKIQTTTQAATEVARIASVQGGILTDAPQGFPGGDRVYTSNKNVKDFLDRMFRGVGVNPNDYEIRVNSRVIDASNGSDRIDYKTPIEVSVSTNYEYLFLGRILRLNPGSFTAKRLSMSEWKYDYDRWDGE